MKKKPALAITLKDLLPSPANGGKKMTEQEVINELIKMGLWDPKARGVKKSSLDKLIKADLAEAAKLSPNAIPKDYPVQPLKPGQPAKDKATCGECGLSWDDGVSTSMTPTPAGRCPFEHFHK